MDGMTTWRASDALAPYCVGFVSGSIIFSCSMIEPGQPCVTTIGKAFSCFKRTWMMNVQPINLGNELRQGVQFRLALAPAVICCPVTREFPEWWRASRLATHLRLSPFLAIA